MGVDVTQIRSRSNGGLPSRTGHLWLRQLGCAVSIASALTLCSAIALAALPAIAHAEECPNAAFRTGPSSHLPDCRAYELVTPPFKDAGRLDALLGLSPEGSSALMDISGGVAGLEGYWAIEGAEPAAYYTVGRTASGWVTTADDLPSSEYLPYLGVGGESDLIGQSLDSQTTVWGERGKWQPDNDLDFFVRPAGQSSLDVGPVAPPILPPELPSELSFTAGFEPVGVSADASRIFFSLQSSYWPGDETQDSYPSLYEYVGTGHAVPMLVGVGEDGRQISQCGVVLGASQPATGGIGASPGNPRDSYNAVSANGSTVYFTAEPKGLKKGSTECTGDGPPVEEVLARIDNGLSDVRTVAISEPSKEDCAACDTEAGVLADAEFEGASEDGSKVFFETRQPLLGSDTSNNLYEYDFDAAAGERVIKVSAGDATVSSPTADVPEPGIEGLRPLISEDGLHVYFLAQGVLTRVPNGQGEGAEAGADNLYVAERETGGSADRVRFVARLSPEDLVRSGWQSGAHAGGDVTPNGRFLVFTSARDLTSDDTSTAPQVFEYDAQTGSLVRVSIGQDGFNHNGNNGNGPAKIASPTYQGKYISAAYWTSLSVSADGSYVFFESPVALTPQALEGISNVYEYHEGLVSLISDGEDLLGSNLLTTDSSGSDVFFTTVDRLAGQDTDTSEDVYDARIDGGFPAPVALPSCSGEACQGQLSGAAPLLSPGSEFQTGGNPPLAGESAAKPAAKAKKKSKKKAKKKAKRKQPRKRVKTGKALATRHGREARKAAMSGRADRKAGRS
jgi:hypothetical protein